METCENHRERQAEAQCSVCGSMLCAECMAPGMESPTCFVCSINGAGRIVEDQAKRVAVEGGIPSPARKGLSKTTLTVVIAGVVVMAFEGWLILGGWGGPRSDTSRASGAQSAATTAEQVTVCDDGRMDAYLRRHGTFPTDLAVVTAGLPEDLLGQLQRAGVEMGDDNKAHQGAQLPDPHQPDVPKVQSNDEKGGQ